MFELMISPNNWPGPTWQLLKLHWRCGRDYIDAWDRADGFTGCATVSKGHNTLISLHQDEVLRKVGA